MAGSIERRGASSDQDGGGSSDAALGSNSRPRFLMRRDCSGAHDGYKTFITGRGPSAHTGTPRTPRTPRTPQPTNPASLATIRRLQDFHEHCLAGVHSVPYNTSRRPRTLLSSPHHSFVILCVSRSSAPLVSAQLSHYISRGGPQTPPACVHMNACEWRRAPTRLPRAAHTNLCVPL